MDLDPEQVSQSLKVSLADLSAKAAALYAHKKFEEATEVYAQAAEMQAEMNGEMSPDNAEILFLYGRALFKVGQSKSDVLGNKAPEATKPKPAKKAKASNSDAEPKNGDSAEAKVDEAAAEAVKDKKPLFHFEGDENLEGSDEDEGSDEGDEDDDDDDDMATAFEILDLARVMYEKKLDAVNAETEADKEAPEGGSPAVRHIRERLGDTHALLAEISLENER
jgi:HAT1-interacting factor 1